MTESNIFPEAFELTSWLVGPYQMRPEGSQSLEEWQIPFHEVALGALKGLAAANHIPDGWVPDPVKGIELYKQLTYERKLHTMIRGLKIYAAERPEEGAIAKFRDNQYDMTNTLAEVFTTAAVGSPIRVKSPTGSGKTAVIVGLTEGLKYKEKRGEEVGVLILVPRKDILGQTTNAFAQFSSNIRPSVYFGEQKNMSDVTVMTYQSFNRAYNEGVLPRNRFDAVIRDESHRAHGDETGRNLRAFCYGNRGNRPLVVFDMSATPKGGGELHYEKTVVEGVGEGLLSPISARRIYTNSRINETEVHRKHDDFLMGEVSGLIDDKARNEQIVQEVLAGLRGGRRTIVRCVRGDNLRHLDVLDKMIRQKGKVEIMNPYMQDIEFRPVHVLAVRGSMSMAERKKIYKIFSEDLNFDLDVLLFVETMTEGWDGPIAKKLINAAPSRSDWLMEQLLGRVLRPYRRYNGELVTAEAVDFIDHSQSGQVSFTDILDRDAPPGMLYREGAIIGKGLIDLRSPWRGENGAFYRAA